MSRLTRLAAKGFGRISARIRLLRTPRSRIIAHGPWWFRRLVSTVDDPELAARVPSVQLDRGRPGIATVTAPFVSPRAGRPGSWSLAGAFLPSEFRRLNRAARRAIPLAAVLAGRRSSRWHEATEHAHPNCRAAHALTLRTAVQSSGWNLVGLADPTIDVICVTNRSQFLDDLVSGFRSQRYEAARLRVVVNSSDVDITALERRLDRLPAEVTVDLRGSLGTCLNGAVAASDAPYFAKWDDDDWYGPDYLIDLLAAAQMSGAAVTGKHSYIAYLEDEDRTVVRFPGHEFRYTSFVAGGTLLVDRARTEGVLFPDRSLGEDGVFLRQCEQRRQLVYSADRFGYIQRRGSHNTWTIGSGDFARGSFGLGPGLRRDHAFV